jgi:3-hydroxybutyrate dehydrogenase
MDYGLKDARVVVTGAAGGIGLAIAQAFIAQGAQVALVDREQDRLADAPDTLPATARADTIACDLRSDSEVSELAGHLMAGFGGVDVLVNNAGQEYVTPLDDQSPAAMPRWSALLDNNVSSMMRTVRALAPLMPDGAAVINQASIWGHSAVGGFSAYVASKHAVIGLTRSLAHALGARRIRVNAVCPGWIRTDAAMRSLAAMAGEQNRSEDDVLNDILGAQVFRRLLEPEDITDTYLFLASRGARAITGQSIVVSNGELMH